MTTEAAILNDQIFDALDECFDKYIQDGISDDYRKQAFYDNFGEKLDEILNSKK